MGRDIKRGKKKKKNWVGAVSLEKYILKRGRNYDSNKRRKAKDKGRIRP